MVNHPSRKRLRLQNHDYRAGWFFLTICAANRAPSFGSIEGVVFVPSPLGKLVERCWTEIPELHKGSQVDEYALMPDHLHGILALDPFGAIVQSRSLGSVVGAFKSRVARLFRAEMGRPSVLIWQRGYYDRVIRGERELFMIRRYIVENAVATTLPPRIGHR